MNTESQDSDVVIGVLKYVDSFQSTILTLKVIYFPKHFVIDFGAKLKYTDIVSTLISDNQ
jgi:hypothetical protein